MKTLFLTCSLFLAVCQQKTEPKTEVWGNASIGYNERTLDKTGKEYFKL